MREILFKAKRIDNGEWVEGWLVPTMQNTYHDGYIIIDVRGINYDELDYFEPTFISFGIDANTICQYTGLTDKNGNKIWENDIVKVLERGIEISGGFIAFFNNYPGGWLITDKYKKSKCSLAMRNDVEVIGNIFDNADLVKE